eukprot:scaffold253272_cov33-Prasinocladus_malaysianus.AAC.1
MPQDYFNTRQRPLPLHHIAAFIYSFDEYETSTLYLSATTMNWRRITTNHIAGFAVRSNRYAIIVVYNYMYIRCVVHRVILSQFADRGDRMPQDFHVP